MKKFLGSNFAHGNGGIPLGIIDNDLFKHESRISILPNKINEINSFLDEIREIPGIECYSY